LTKNEFEVTKWAAVRDMMSTDRSKLVLHITGVYLKICQSGVYISQIQY